MRACGEALRTQSTRMPHHCPSAVAIASKASEMAQGTCPKRGKAFVSFTGGKDCHLALAKAQEEWDIAGLVTFVPAGGGQRFLAHLLSVMRAQAASLGLPHRCVEVADGPGGFLGSYRDAILRFRQQDGVEALVTGDILDVCDRFMERACEGTGVELVRPLWGVPRGALLSQLREARAESIVTCASIAALGKEASEALVGRPFDDAAVGVLASVPGADLCGERGEVHTMVVHWPGLYAGRVDMQGFAPRTDESGKYLYYAPAAIAAG